LPSPFIPRNPDDFARPPDFCFPSGFSAARSTKASLKQPLILLDQFVFQMQSGVFSMCTTFCLADARDSFFFNSPTKVYPTCFCILTSVRCFAALFHFELCLAKWIAGIDISIGVHSFQVEPPASDSITSLPAMALAGSCLSRGGFLIPRDFAAELAFARSLKLDPAKHRVITLSDKDGMIIPSRASVPHLVEYTTLELLFSRLSIVNIVRAVSCFVLKKHVVIVSASIR
jgi:hypothetical protein